MKVETTRKLVLELDMETAMWLKAFVQNPHTINDFENEDPRDLAKRTELFEVLKEFTESNKKFKRPEIDDEWVV